MGKGKKKRALTKTLSNPNLIIIKMKKVTFSYINTLKQQKVTLFYKLFLKIISPHKKRER